MNVFTLKGYTVDAKEPDPDLNILNTSSLDLAISDDGIVRTHEQFLGIYTTVEAAEKVISPWLKQMEEWSEVVLGLILTENSLDAGLITGECDSENGTFDLGKVSAYESIRSYLRDGSLNCFHDNDDLCQKPFAGRKDPCAAESSKYVICLRSNGRSIVSTVVATPPSVEWWKTNLNPSAKGDTMDDSYTLVDCRSNGHDHVLAPYVFPMIGQVPKRLKASLASAANSYLNGSEFGTNI